MYQNFLFEKVKTFCKKNEVSKADIWRNVEHVTYLAKYKEISLDDAERYFTILFKMLEELEAKES